MKRIIFILLLIGQSLYGQVKVTFKVTGVPDKTPEPKLLFLAGSFNGWKAADASWKLVDNTLQVTIPPGNYEFKITRGTWDKVECGVKGAEMANRDLHVVHDTTITITVTDWKDNYPAQVKQHTASKQVHLISDQFEIPQLGRKRRVWIYLPVGYETSHKKYPVIYMHDGQNLFDEFTTGYGVEWGVDEFLDQLKPGEREYIIVGIDHGGDYRITEYDPYDSSYGKGVGDAYVRFLVETLKPYIDTHYQTLKDAKNTTVAGSSMGGLISMYAELKYPEIFGSAGIFSPAFWIAPQIYDYAKAHALKTSRYYFVCGDKESDTETDTMNKMVAILKDKGLSEKNAPSTIIKGAKHNEAQWRGDLPDFYNWLEASK